MLIQQIRKEIAEVNKFAHYYTSYIDLRQQGEEYLGLTIGMKNIGDNISRGEKMNRRTDDRHGIQTR